MPSRKFTTPYGDARDFMIVSQSFRHSIRTLFMAGGDYDAFEILRYGFRQTLLQNF